MTTEVPKSKSKLSDLGNNTRNVLEKKDHILKRRNLLAKSLTSVKLHFNSQIHEQGAGSQATKNAANGKWSYVKYYILVLVSNTVRTVGFKQGLYNVIVLFRCFQPKCQILESPVGI